MVNPDHPSKMTRRSFLYRVLDGLGAQWRDWEDTAIVGSFGGEGESSAARHLGMADLSPLRRLGFKGRHCLEWLSKSGIAGLEENNRAYAREDGSWIARLAPGEVVLLCDLAGSGDLDRRLLAAWQDDRPSLCYPVWRREGNFWFAVTGERAPEMFAKICAIDLRRGRFADGAVAQTSAARMNAIIIRHDLGKLPFYSVLGDSASAEYFWACLTDAMDEFGGRPIGLTALLPSGQG